MRNFFKKANILILFLTAISFFVWFRVWETHSEKKTDKLTVTFLNVGQGDSILIQTPSNKNILIDGGSYPMEWSNFNAGKQVILPFLRKKRIKKLDFVIATHPHLDHIGGLIEVTNRIPIDKFIDSGLSTTSVIYENLLSIIEKKEINYQIAKKGILFKDENLSLELFSPIPGDLTPDLNENSITAKLTYKNISFLFTGDIMKIAEDYYVSKFNDKLQSTILKVAHHGSSSSSTEAFLKAVSADIAIITCGKNNPFGFPTKSTIKRLEKLNIEVIRTDEAGHISISTDGNEYNIYTQK